MNGSLVDGERVEARRLPRVWLQFSVIHDAFNDNGKKAIFSDLSAPIRRLSARILVLEFTIDRVLLNLIIFIVAAGLILMDC